MGSVIGLSAGLTYPSRTSAVVTEIVRQLAENGMVPAGLVEFDGVVIHRSWDAEAGPGGVEMDVLRRAERAAVLVIGVPAHGDGGTRAMGRLLGRMDRRLLAEKVVLLASVGPRPVAVTGLTIAARIHGWPEDFTNGGAIGPVLRDRIRRIARATAALFGTPPRRCCIAASVH